MALDHPVREAPHSPCGTGRLKEDMAKNEHIRPLTPAALYDRVSSHRQDVDFSMASQLRTQ